MPPYGGAMALPCRLSNVGPGVIPLDEGHSGMLPAAEACV